MDTTTAINAGEYSVKLIINEIYAEEDYETLTFTIAKQQITSVLFDGAVTASKTYDGNSNVINAISSHNVYAGDDITFTAKYVYLSDEIYKIAKKIELYKTSLGVFCKVEL